MRRSFFGLVTILAACATPTAQAPASPAPAARPLDPPAVTEGDVTEAHLGGMTVLVKRLPTAELVTAQLYVRGGALNWTQANAGVEKLAFSVAAAGGTQSLDKSAFARRLAGLGADVNAETTRDWSMVQGKGPLAASTALLGLVADVFLHPALPASEVEVARRQQLILIQRQQENPDGRLSALLDEVRFKGHPYEVRPEGTAATVKALTPEALKAHLEGLRETSRLVLVVVGNVDPAEVQAQAKALFGGLPRGAFATKVPPAPVIAASSLVTEARPLPTNYLKGVFNGPAAGTTDYAAGFALQPLLWERLFYEVRTKRNLSYAPGYVWDLSGAGTYGGLSVTAVDPDTTWKVMVQVLQRLKDEAVPAEELAGAKAESRTSMLTRQETTDGQASALGGGLLLTGDWRFRARLAEQVQAVKAEDIQAYARKYFGKLQVVLLGDPVKLSPSVATTL